MRVRLRMLAVLVCCIAMGSIKAQTFQVDTIQYNGNPSQYINLVFLGDGFQASELNTYINNVKNLTNYFFTIQPFAEYRNYFNVFAVRVPSSQSGANHPGTASDEASSNGQPVTVVANYFNSTFDYFAIHRLIVPQNSVAVNSVLNANFPLYDQTFMLVNSSYYGGSGGSNLATSSLNSSSYEVLVHEVGHSFAGLSDEYWAGDIYAAENTNMTQQSNPALVRWKDWVGSYGVGVFQYCCGGNASLWFKPSQSCKMQVLGQPFCPVCRERIIETIHNVLPARRSVAPASGSTLTYCSQPLTFKLGLVKPNPNTIRVSWILNGTRIALNEDSIVVEGGQLAAGVNNLSAIIIDTTDMIRIASHATAHADTVKWVINSNVSAPVISTTGTLTFCAGGSVTLSSSPGTAYLWSNGATTKDIVVTSGGDYTVTRSDAGGCKATSTAVTVSVTPLPAQPNTITGEPKPCPGTAQTYSVAAVNGATSYTWTLPAGWTGTSTTSSLTATAGTTGGTLSVTANNACGSSAARTLVLAPATTPAIPAAITGELNPCAATAQTYSVAAVAGATSYTWTTPAGWTGTSTTNALTVTTGTSTGNVTVAAVNACGSSGIKTLAVTVRKVTVAPGTIAGATSSTTGQSINYSVPAMAGATGYAWSVDNGGTIASGQNTTTAEINWTTAGSHQLSVAAVNECGNSPASTLTVIVSLATSVVDPDDQFEIRVLPNPSDGDFHLRARNVLNKDISIEVVNMAGQRVFFAHYPIRSNEFTLPIDLRSAADGVYSIRIGIDKKTYYRRIMKRK